MNTNDIREHLLSKAPWVDRETTVDTVKSGDPTREIRSVAVGWMSTMDNLRIAHENECDLFITHEPTFWHHSQAEEPARMDQVGVRLNSRETNIRVVIFADLQRGAC